MANNPFLADVPHRHYLREWRKERGLTQKQLAKKIDMDETVICRFESGARGVSLEIMLELFKALDVTPGQFFSPPGTPDLNLMCERMTAKQRRRVVNYARMVLDSDDDD